MKLVIANSNEELKLYSDYYITLSYGFDKYYENMIINSRHYLIKDDNEIIGITSINSDLMLTGLYIKDEYKQLQSDIFNFVLNEGNIKSIITITNDYGIMREIIVRNYKVDVQALNFTFMGKAETEFSMVSAKEYELPKITAIFGDFIDDYKEKMDESGLYLGYNYKREIVSLGVIDNHILNKEVVCIGMIVVESERRKGYGVKTLRFLTQLLQRNNKEVHAGCYYFNIASKKTLIKAGFTVTNLIIRVDDINTFRKKR